MNILCGLYRVLHTKINKIFWHYQTFSYLIVYVIIRSCFFVTFFLDPFLVSAVSDTRGLILFPLSVNCQLSTVVYMWTLFLRKTGRRKELVNSFAVERNMLNSSGTG